MSYNIIICRKPIPQKRIAAWDYIYKLMDNRFDIDKKAPGDYLSFYKRVTKKFPCRNDLSGKRRNHCVWSEAPLINNFTYELIVLGILYSHVEEVLPFMIKEVKRTGLVLFDPQTEEIYL